MFFIIGITFTGHKYVRVTDAYTAGNYIYQYGEQYGMKGPPDFIMFPVLSHKRLTYYRDSTGEKVKVKLIAQRRKHTSANIDSYGLDTGAIVIQGLVRKAGIHGMRDDEKELLQKENIALADDFIFITDDEPESAKMIIFLLIIGPCIMFFSLRSFFKK